jgi:hypothetical protein
MTSPLAARQTAAYGRGLLLDDGDLVLDNGALVEVSGLVNLRQGLLLRLETPWASDLLNTGYGLDVLEGFTSGLSRARSKDVLRLSIVRTLSADPRVAAVDQVLFDDDPEYLADHPRDAGVDRRRALVQVTVQPVALPVAGTQTTAAAAPSDAVTLLADVRW